MVLIDIVWEKNIHSEAISEEIKREIKKDKNEIINTWEPNLDNES